MSLTPLKNIPFSTLSIIRIGTYLLQVIRFHVSSQPRSLSTHFVIMIIVTVKTFTSSEQNMKRAASVMRKHLVSFGTCFGKFTKTKQFRLHVTALDYLAPYAKVRSPSCHRYTAKLLVHQTPTRHSDYMMIGQ